MTGDEPRWPREDAEALAALAHLMRDRLDELVEVIARAEGAPALPAEERRRRLGEALGRLEEAAARGDLSGFLELYERRVRELALSGQDYDQAARAVVGALDPALEIVLRASPDLAAAAPLLRALARLRTELLVAVGRAFVRVREAAIEDEHRKVIRELSTPVIQVWEGVLVMPLIGVVDSVRARQITEQLLEGIVERQARIVIVDITGVATVDSQVANHLLRTTQAARLVGARSILVGISPQVAQALVRLGVSLGDLETYLDLRSGLERALALLGLTVVTRAPARAGAAAAAQPEGAGGEPAS